MPHSFHLLSLIQLYLGLLIVSIVGLPVDSMSLVSIDGLPNGLTLSCFYSNCVLPGSVNFSGLSMELL